MKTIRMVSLWFIILALIIPLSFIACQNKKEQASTAQSSTPTTPPAKPPVQTTPPATAAKAAPAPIKSDKNVTRDSAAAIIEMTNGGRIVFQFYPKDAPNTVDNFIKLANKGFYNGLTFHRVEPGFVVQGGDPRGDGTGGPGYTIKAEFNQQKHITGAVAMARSDDPNSAGSQFYICLAPASFLDGQYTVFGQVVEGMDLVQKIKIGDKMKQVVIVNKASLKK